MIFNQYDNDSRFWLFNTTIGKWLIRLEVLVVFFLVVLNCIGLIN